MTLFTLAIMIPGLASGPCYGRRIKVLYKLISDEKAKATSIAEEAFSNIRTVKAFATEDRECNMYSETNNEVFKYARKAAIAYGLFSFAMQFIMFGSLDALVYFAAYLNSEGSLSIGQFTSFQFYMFSFLINFMMMTSVIGEVMGVFGTTAAIAEIFLYESKVNTTGGEEVTQQSLDNGNIRLEDIEFTYPTK